MVLIIEVIFLNFRVLLGFFTAVLVATLIFTFWASGDVNRYLKVFPLVFIVALVQTVVVALPVYLWLKRKGNLRLKKVVCYAILVAVSPWLILQPISALDHEMLRVGGKVLIDNGNLTVNWWFRYLGSMLRLALCGLIAGLVFYFFIKDSTRKVQ